MAETRVVGMKQLVAALDRLPAELGKKAVWSALGGAGAEVKKEAKARVPVLAQSTPTRTAGTVKDAIRVSRSKINKGKNGFYEVIVRVKPLKKGRGAKNPKDPFYWWFLEFGTSKMPARPFLRPAFESTKTAQLAGIKRRMAASIEKQAAKIKQEVNNAT